MPTQNVNLTDQLEAFVKKQVEEGYFNSASEVHRAALAAMARREEEHRVRMARLKAEVQQGLDDLDQGRHVEFEDPEALQAYMDGVLEKVLNFEQLDAEPA